MRVCVRVLIVLSVLVCLCPGVFAAVAGDLDSGFRKAFSDPEQFRLTDLFRVLGYTDQQIRQIVEVTPRPASLTVTCTEAPDRPGFFPSIAVSAHRVKYYNLTIDRAEFAFDQVQLDPSALREGLIRFRGVGEVKIETNVSTADILKVFELVTRARQLSDLRLTINSRETLLKGNVKKGFLLIAFAIQGKPQLTNQKKVDFICHRMLLNGMKLPRSAINAIFAKINPVFDATKTWLNLELQSIELLTGYVRSRGIIRRAGG